MRTVRSVVLAAGAGRRMGGNKGLVSFRGRPLIEHVLDVIDASALAGAVVVTGAEADALTPLVESRGVVCVHNEQWCKGQSQSVRRGVAALPVDTEAFLIHPVDHALATSSDLDALVEAFVARADADRCIARPVCGEAFGHPVLFSADYRADFESLRPEDPANTVYRANRESVILVPVNNSRISVDLDTPEDLARYESG